MCPCYGPKVRLDYFFNKSSLTLREVRYDGNGSDESNTNGDLNETSDLTERSDELNLAIASHVNNYSKLCSDSKVCFPKNHFMKFKCVLSSVGSYGLKSTVRVYPKTFDTFQIVSNYVDVCKWTVFCY